MRNGLLYQLLTCGLVLLAGCRSNSPSEDSVSQRSNEQRRSTGRYAKVVPPPPRFTPTAQSNPTINCRPNCQPNVDDPFCPAAWIFVDGHAGYFADRDGAPQMQWVIDQPVSSTPTFRVEALESVLGSAVNFKCVFQSISPNGDAKVLYGISNEDGSFKVGQDYSLLMPGEEFLMLDRSADTSVSEIPPLAPGSYMLVGKIEDRRTKKAALAVTYFTVAGN